MSQEPDKETHKMFGRDESYKSHWRAQPAKDPVGKTADNVVKKFGDIMTKLCSPSFYWGLIKKLFQG